MNIPLNCIIIPESVFVAIEEIYNLAQLHSVKRKQDQKAVCYGEMIPSKKKKKRKNQVI